MKRAKKLLVLCGVLVLLLSAYALISHSTKRAEEAAAAREAAVIVISDRAGSEVSRLDWNYKGERASFVQEEGLWRDPDDTAFPADQDALARMAAAVADISSGRMLEPTENLKQYGLDAPDIAVQVSYTDGSSAAYSVGDLNSLTNEYYVNCNGSIYMLDSTIPDAFSVSRWSLIRPEELPALESPRALTVSTGAGTLALAYREEGGDFYTDEYKWFLRSEGGELAADTQKVEALLSALEELDLSNTQAYNVTAEQLADWGLAEPRAAVTVDYERDGGAACLVLELGDCDDGRCYLRLKDSPMVYSVDASTAESFLLLDYESSLRPDEICRIDINGISALDIVLDGESHRVEVGTKTVTTTRTNAETGEEEESITQEPLYTLDGRELESASLRSVLAQIYSMSAEAEDGQAELAGAEQLRLVYHRDEGEWDSMELVFRSYDSSRCLVEFNGWNHLLCSKSAVDGMLHTLRELLD